MRLAQSKSFISELPRQQIPGFMSPISGSQL
ncbi:hypothetical protein OIU78_012837 [Salix suchowensis]|nr:hypothetical protein OIU78_012837 [Salix suchowensis]